MFLGLTTKFLDQLLTKKQTRWIQPYRLNNLFFQILLPNKANTKASTLNRRIYLAINPEKRLMATQKLKYN